MGIFVRKYWKLSERLMIKDADLIICDSKHIELYIREKYRSYKPKTIYSSYGADVATSQDVKAQDLQNWFNKKQISSGQYYLVVGRFVPENNYQTIVAEFEKSKTKKDLVIITNPDNTKFLKSLKDQTGFEKITELNLLALCMTRTFYLQSGEMHLDTSMGMKWAELIPLYWKLWEPQI